MDDLKRAGLALAAVALLVCVAFAGIIVVQASKPLLTPEAVVGAWSGGYENGHVELELKADGTYEARFSQFRIPSSLPYRDATGTWSIEDGRVRLAWASLSPSYRLFSNRVFLLTQEEMVRLKRPD
jgi:hypothetical protein